MDEQRFTIVSSSDIIARFRCKCACRLRSYNASAETVVDKKRKEKKRVGNLERNLDIRDTKGFRDRWTINKRSLLSPWIVRFDSRVTNRADNEGGGVKKRGGKKRKVR